MLDDDLKVPAAHTQLRGPLQSTSTPLESEPADLLSEKLFEWQQKRLQRQLKGEYESKVIRLNELVGGNLSTPLRINNVRIEGATKTRPSFLARVVNPYFTPISPISPPSRDSPSSAHFLSEDLPDKSTLETVLHQTRLIGNALARTQLFKQVIPELQTPKDVMASVEDVDVVFKVEERGRFSLKSATEVGDGDATASASVKLLNAFGGAEELEGSASYGMRTSHTYRLALSAPITASMLTRGELSTYSVDNDYNLWASCREGQKGVRAAISTYSVFGRHEFSYQAVLRHIHSLNPNASLSIRQAAGTSFKSSIYHTFIRDTRDDAIMGTRGAYFKLTQELAGLGGDTAFAKAEGESQFSRRIMKGLHVSFAARAGLLYSLGGKRSMFNDRFKLGGPMNVRSFKFHSLGPRDEGENLFPGQRQTTILKLRREGDAVGGDAYWAAGISLIGDLPQKPHWPLKLHTYINAGKLAALDRTRPLSESLGSAASNPSVSVGIGLIYRFEPLRLELNFGMPLFAYKTDGYQRGIQIGFGVECL